MSIYLDHAATTPVDPRVLQAMEPYFSENFGNPSSLHTAGQNAKKAVDTARKSVAEQLECAPGEVIFTGSGTESDNLAIFGIASAYEHAGKHIITSLIEHEAVLEPFKVLEKKGWRVTWLPVDREGVVKLDELKRALTPETVLVSVMTANNEIGTLEPIEKITQIVRDYRSELKRHGANPEPPFVHTDSCQAAGVLDLNVEKLGVDLLTLNGSKIYGPKGVGALYVKSGIHLSPQLSGGGQEKGRRSGTENVPCIVGLAKALEFAQSERDTENPRLTTLRDRLVSGITSRLPDVQLNGHPTQRLPNNINFTLKGVEGEILLLRLDMEGIYASAGSACTTGKAEPSHVLHAIGVSKQDAYSAVRFSLGKSNTEADIDHVIDVFVRVVKEIRSESGVY